MRESFGDHIRNTIAVALWVDHPGVPENVRPTVLLFHGLRWERAAQRDRAAESVAVDTALQLVSQWAVTNNSQVERHAPRLQQSTGGELVVVAFLWDKASDGKQADRSGGSIARKFLGKSIETPACENDLYRRAACAFAQIRDARCGGRVDETGGAEFG